MSFKLIASSAAVAVLAALAVSAPAAAQVRGAPAVASYYAPGFCLDMRATDSQVLLWACHGGSNQAFRFVSGSYGMISLGDQRCLTSGLQSGAPLTVQPCTNAANQRWGFQANGTLRTEGQAAEGGRPAVPSLCADIEGGGRGNGSRILGYTCQGSANQQWYPAVTARSAPVGLAAAAKFQGRPAKGFLSSPGFSGGNIVGSGGGNIVASGGGNLIANDGASIIAGGAGNMLARAGGLIANDGASIIAGGAGNALPGNWSFFSSAGAGIIAGGAGN